MDGAFPLIPISIPFPMKTQIKFSPAVLTEAANLLGIAMANPKHDLFFEYMGHVKSVTISAHRGGWSENVPADFNRRIFFFDSEKEYLNELVKARKDLELVLADWDIASEDESFCAKAKAMRDAAAKLLADADALTAPKQEVAP